MAALAAAAAPASVYAHPGHSARLEHADHKIKADPAAAENYLQRGEVHCERGRYNKAKADFARARKRAPKDAKLRLRIARAWLDAGQFDSAREAAQALTDLEPAHGQGWLVLAVAASATKQHATAVQAIDHAFEHTDFPDLVMFAHRGRIQLAAATVAERAVAGLYQGIVQLGANVVLLELAIEAELARSRPDAALGLLSLLPPPLSSSPKWLLRRAELHAANGDANAACSSLAEVRTVLDALPERRRVQPWVAQLEVSLRSVAAKIECKN